MDSYQSKPSGLKKPSDKITATRIKPMSFSQNFCILNQKDIPKVLRDSPKCINRNTQERQKIRRSLSAADIKTTNEMVQTLKRHKSVLNGSSKMSRCSISNVTSTTKRNPPLIVPPSSRFKNDQIKPLNHSALKNQPTIVSKNNTNLGNASGNDIKTMSSIYLNKKIPAYDYKARYADLLEKHKELKEKFDHTKEQLAILDALPEKLEESKNEIIELQSILQMEKKQTQCLQQQNNAISIKITALTKNLKNVTKKYEDEKRKREELLHEFTTISNEEIGSTFLFLHWIVYFIFVCISILILKRCIYFFCLILYMIYLYIF